MAVGTEVSVREWILPSRHGKIDAEHVIGAKRQQQRSYNKPEKGCPDKFQLLPACRGLNKRNWMGVPMAATRKMM